MMSAEHRRPLAGFVVVAAAACLIMSVGLQPQVNRVFVVGGAPQAQMPAVGADVVLGQSLDRAQARLPATPDQDTSTSSNPGGASRPTGTSPATAPVSVVSVVTVAAPLVTSRPAARPALDPKPVVKPAVKPVVKPAVKPGPPSKKPGVTPKPDKPVVAPAKPGSGIGTGHSATTRNAGFVARPEQSAEKSPAKGSDKQSDKRFDKGSDKGSDKRFDQGSDKRFDQGSDRGNSAHQARGSEERPPLPKVGPGKADEREHDRGDRGDGGHRSRGH